MELRLGDRFEHQDTAVVVQDILMDPFRIMWEAEDGSCGATTDGPTFLRAATKRPRIDTSSAAIKRDLLNAFTSAEARSLRHAAAAARELSDWVLARPAAERPAPDEVLHLLAGQLDAAAAYKEDEAA